MMPMMPGPNPQAFGALAIALAFGAGSALIAMAALLGWTALELVCLIETYREA